MLQSESNVLVAKSKLSSEDLLFVHEFEDLSLDSAKFNHEGHLRIAFIYFTLHDKQSAVESIETGIKRYAESLGVADKFHRTITFALAQVVHNRIEMLFERLKHPVIWSEFLKVNQDILHNALTILESHYSRDLLFSDKARKNILLPDKTFAYRDN